MNSLEEKLRELVNNGTLAGYSLINLDENGNAGRSKFRNTESLTLTFPNGGTLNLGTFCSGCLENTGFVLDGE